MTPGSDRGPSDLKSCALPTELSWLIDSHFPVGDTVFLYIFICIKIALLPRPGIGPRPSDLQSDALPTELSRLIGSHFPVGDTVFLYIFICIKIALLP